VATLAVQWPKYANSSVMPEMHAVIVHVKLTSNVSYLNVI